MGQDPESRYRRVRLGVRGAHTRPELARPCDVHKNKGTMDTLSVSAFAPANNFGFSYGAGFIQQGASPSQIYGRNGQGGVAALGDYEPKFIMGFSSDVTFRRFRLSGLLDGGMGQCR